MPDIIFDVDIDDFYSECSNSELETLASWLTEDGYLNKNESLDFPNQPNILDKDWEDSIIKLAKNRHQLTQEEEAFIQELANKIV